MARATTGRDRQGADAGASRARRARAADPGASGRLELRARRSQLRRHRCRCPSRRVPRRVSARGRRVVVPCAAVGAAVGRRTWTIEAGGERLARRRSSMPREPGRTRSQIAAELRRSASRLIAEPSSSCGLGGRTAGAAAGHRRPRHASTSRAKSTTACGSARTTRSPAIRAMRRPRRSTSPRRSSISRRWSTGPSSGSSGDGPGLRSFAPDRVPVYGFEPTRRDFSGAPGRAASESRPLRRSGIGCCGSARAA